MYVAGTLVLPGPGIENSLVVLRTTPVGPVWPAGPFCLVGGTVGIVTVEGNFVTVLPSGLIMYIVATPVPWSETHTGGFSPGFCGKFMSQGLTRLGSVIWAILGMSDTRGVIW